MKHPPIATLLSLLAASIIANGCSPSAVPSHEPAYPNEGGDRALDSGWVCQNVGAVRFSGEELSRASLPLSGWLPATVPGTVLTTLLNNSLVPDPFFGMNNKAIPDIAESGRDTYTYWFVKNFRTDPPGGTRRFWLHFRGVNYGCDIFLNGHRLNQKTHYGMFLRQVYDVTSLLSQNGDNRLAVLVYPPDPVGIPNGGQGGDGTIGHTVGSQYVAGWDWIQPVPDRNTGIWDRVSIEETNGVRLDNPFVVTKVPGTRLPDTPQSPVTLQARVDVENPWSAPVRGTLQFLIGGATINTEVTLQPGRTEEFRFPDYILSNPHLWWPNGYGRQEMYPVQFRFLGPNGETLAECATHIGIREIQTLWNDHTRSREIKVNGQRVFIKGGNWIVSDEMLRFSPERYDAEIRYHRDMNLNLIRIWGGGITERPEFYDACDRNGILVFQDFWMSGDCNGKWFDPKKSEDQWARRSYPDDHALFLKSVADQVAMIRNHPSLAFYCGGNEIPPPQDILEVIQDSLLPATDGTRYFFTFSNVDSMSYNHLGGNGDGPYWPQPPEHFWDFRSFPFNSEIGSAGMGDYESLERFIPPGDLVIPDPERGKLDSVWAYHKYLGYGGHIDAYGKPATLREFADRAQLVNYDQYRALMEGHQSHMWDWYTGVIIWKTQNPWTALRGQMYDWYLDPNAGLYGLNHANRPVHVMCHPADDMLMVVNNTFRPCHDLMVQARAIDFNGRDSLVFQWLVEVSPSSVLKLESVKKFIRPLFSTRGGFLNLRLIKSSREVIDENLYWLPDSSGIYSGLQAMQPADVRAWARNAGSGKIDVTIENPAGGPLAFFNRISVIDRNTGKRILPAFASDNYVSVLPGELKTITLEFTAGPGTIPAVSLSGWNVPQRILDWR